MNRIAISPKMMGVAIALVGLLVGGGAIYIGQAFADSYHQQPTAVSGTDTRTFLPSSLISSKNVSDGPVGPYTVAYYAPTFVWTGGITGNFACNIIVITNPDGVTLEANGTCTFTGTVTGGRGPGTMSFSFTDTDSFTTPTPEGSYQEHFAFSGGAGGLYNIQSIEGTDAGVLNPPNPPFNTATNTAGVYGALVVYNNNR